MDRVYAPRYAGPQRSEMISAVELAIDGRDLIITKEYFPI
jgi:hypothetical protein